MYRAGVTDGRENLHPPADSSDHVCASCGRDADDLEPVRRVYLTVRDGRMEAGDPLPEVERWCAACRSQYPHQPAS